MPPLRRAWPLAAVAIFAVSVACDAATAQSRGGGGGAPVAAPAALPHESEHKLVVVDTERSSGPDVTRPVDLYTRRLGGACSPGAGDRATSLPAVDAVLERRNPSRPIRRPRSVAGQPQRDGSERARRRRQELGRLHGLLGPRDAHDQSRVAVCLSAHPAGVSDGAVRRNSTRRLSRPATRRLRAALICFRHDDYTYSRSEPRDGGNPVGRLQPRGPE